MFQGRREAHKLKTISEKAEIDIKLMTLFTKIMSVANGRGGYIVSDKIIEDFFEKNIFKIEDIKNKDDMIKELNKKITDLSTITIPVGLAEQNAAIAAIAKLGERHEVLRSVAYEGLKSLSSNGIAGADEYFEKLNK